MKYDPFNFLGTDKRQRVDSKTINLAQDVVTEYKLREVIRKIIKKEND